MDKPQWSLHNVMDSRALMEVFKSVNKIQSWKALSLVSGLKYPGRQRKHRIGI